MSPRWSPDDQAARVPAPTSGGNERFEYLARTPLDGGEERNLTNEPDVSTARYLWSPTGRGNSGTSRTRAGKAFAVPT